LREHVTGRETVREIPKGQRLIGRASLKKLFDGGGERKSGTGSNDIEGGKRARLQPDGSGSPSKAALLYDQPIDQEYQRRTKVKT